MTACDRCEQPHQALINLCFLFESVSTKSSCWCLGLEVLGDGGEEQCQQLRTLGEGPGAVRKRPQLVAWRWALARLVRNGHLSFFTQAKTSWTTAVRCLSEAMAARLQPDPRCLGAQLAALPWHLAMTLFGEEMDLEATALADYAMALRRGGQFLRLRPTREPETASVAS